jgi:hypothetical protein
MRTPWHVTVIRPAGYDPAATFDEVAGGLVWSLLTLGHTVSYADNNVRADAHNVVFGAHLLRPDQWPILDQVRSLVVYNFEQLPTQLAVWRGYEALLRRYPVWDYAESNVHWLRTTWGLTAQHVPVGYVPLWTRIPPSTVRDIDVLFYGSLSPRRQAVIRDLQAAGLRVAAVFNVWGWARDALIARSRVILNCHQYGPDDPVEWLRLLYAWANRCAVVAEVKTPLHVPPGFRQAAVWAPYHALVDACRALVADSERQTALRAAGFAAVQHHPWPPMLAPVVGDLTSTE